jgi:TonB family protein
MWLWSWQVLLLIAGAAIVAVAVHPRTAAHRDTFWLVVLLLAASLPAASAVALWFPDLPRPALTMPIPESLQTVDEDIHGAVTPRNQAPNPDVGYQQPSRLHWPSAAGVALMVWLIGFALSLLGSVRSYLIHRAYRSAALPSEQIDSSRGLVPIAYSASVQIPVLVGFRSPVILLPQRIREWLTGEEERAVILHELAHYERSDQWIALPQLFLRALFFFHPAVRYASRQLSLARELACDERVLRGGIAPAVYTEAILKIAERCVVRNEILSPAMNTSARFLDRRLQMIRRYNHTLAGRTPVASLVRLAAVVLLAVLLLPERVLTSQIPAAVTTAITEEPNSVIAEQAVTAAEQLSTLSGVIWEPEGRLINGLEVFLTSQESGTAYTTVSSGRGNFEFVDVAPGRYIVSTRTPAIGLLSWNPFQADVTLKPGRQTLPIQFVRAGAPPFVAAAVVPAAAQAAPGIVSGRVFDQTGAFVPGVVLELRNGDLVVGSSLSNEGGSYRLSVPQPGRYTLQASLPGFSLHRRTVDVRAGEMLTQNVLLQLAPTSTMVEVSAQKGALVSIPETPTRVGGDVSAPNLIFSPKPAYPPRARALHMEGDVVLQAVITDEGTIASVHVDPNQSTTDLDLIQAASDSVKQWRYRPAMLNGKPTEVTTTITVTFSLFE